MPDKVAVTRAAEAGLGTRAFILEFSFPTENREISALLWKILLPGDHFSTYVTQVRTTFIILIIN
jgi:hypothetical protein